MNAGYGFSLPIRRMGPGRMPRRAPGDCWRVYMCFAIRFALLQRTTDGFRTFSQLVAGNEWRLFNRLRMTGGHSFVSWMDSAAKRARFRQPFRFGRKTRGFPPIILGAHNCLHFNWTDIWMSISECAMKAWLKVSQETSAGLHLGSMHAPRLPRRRLRPGAGTLQGGSPRFCPRRMRRRGRDRWEDGPRYRGRTVRLPRRVCSCQRHRSSCLNRGTRYSSCSRRRPARARPSSGPC